MKYKIEVFKEKDGAVKTSSTVAKNTPVAREVFAWAKTFIGKELPDGRVVDVKITRV